MSPDGWLNMQRIEELLSDQALVGLEAREQAELEALLARTPEADPAALERFVAELQMALLSDEDEASAPLPDGLLRALEASASEHLPRAAQASVATGAPRPGPGSSVPRSSVLTWTGWLAAAALLFALVLRWEPAAAPDPVTLAEARAELVESAPDALQVAWSATEHPHVEGVEIGGDVVWSNARQRGYMRLRNLPVNDPSTRQYQLWIFDKQRPDAHPVDGGVFDVTAAGEVIVAIDAKLDVSDPSLFAITLEQPGGVVVSDRTGLVLVAQPPG